MGTSVTSPRTTRGRPLPLGATPMADGVNFALLCRHGTAVWLVLSPEDHNKPFAEIALDPHFNRTGAHWHAPGHRVFCEFRSTSTSTQT